MTELGSSPRIAAERCEPPSRRAGRRGSKPVGLVDAGLGGEEREPALLEQRRSALEQRGVAGGDAGHVRRARLEEGALTQRRELAEAIDDARGVAEPRDVVEQRRLHRELAEAPSTVGRDPKQLSRGREARPVRGKPRMGAVDVRVEQASFPDFELGTRSRSTALLRGRPRGAFRRRRERTPTARSRRARDLGCCGRA